MTYLGKIMRARHSERVSFDPERAPSESDLWEILEAARWAPTAHNMQNFEVIVVDDPATLAAIDRVRAGTSTEFIRENYAQLSFSEEELIAKGTGLLASMFPPSWLNPDAEPEEPADLEHGFLDATMRSSHRRAPASEGDFLGIMSLGCVLENIWLMAEELGLGLQVMSVFSAGHVEDELRRILSIPTQLKIAFACRMARPNTPEIQRSSRANPQRGWPLFPRFGPNRAVSHLHRLNPRTEPGRHQKRQAQRPPNWST